MQHNYKLLGLLLLFGLVSAIKAQSADSTASDTLINLKRAYCTHQGFGILCIFSQWKVARKRWLG